MVYKRFVFAFSWISFTWRKFEILLINDQSFAALG